MSDSRKKNKSNMMLFKPICTVPRLPVGGEGVYRRVEEAEAGETLGALLRDGPGAARGRHGGGGHHRTAREAHRAGEGHAGLEIIPTGKSLLEGLWLRKCNKTKQELSLYYGLCSHFWLTAAEFLPFSTLLFSTEAFCRIPR